MSDKIDLNKLRVGMPAFSYRFGSCKIIGIGAEDDAYPITVRYDSNAENNTYTNDGRVYADEARDLFFSDPRILARLQPATVIPGEVIVIVDSTPHGDKIYKVCFVKDIDESDVAALEVIACNNLSSIGSRTYVDLNRIKYTRVVE